MTPLASCRSQQEEGQDQEDSCLFISPPTLTSYGEADTPRPYYLRGQPKYSSTPFLLPPAPTSGEKQELVATNLEARLGSLEEQEDSGFCSLSSEADSLKDTPSSPPPPSLGALPKRRSPRNLSKNLDSISRLTKLKPCRDGSSLVQESASFVNFSQPPLHHTESQRRVLFRYCSLSYLLTYGSSTIQVPPPP